MGSSPTTGTIKITTPAGCGYFYGIRGNLKCSAEVNSACAEVLPAAKRSHGAKAPPARRPVEWSFYTLSRFQNENFNRPFHVGAKSALLRRLFMPKAKKTSSARSLAHPFQLRPAALGSQLVCRPAGGFFMPASDISLATSFFISLQSSSRAH